MPEFTDLVGTLLVENATAWTWVRVGNVWRCTGLVNITTDYPIPFEVSFSIGLPFVPMYPFNGCAGLLTGTSVPDSGIAPWIAGIVRQAGPTTVRATLSAGYWNDVGVVPVAITFELLAFGVP